MQHLTTALKSCNLQVTINLNPEAMRPLIIGILLFLVWLALSTWYYTTQIFPVFSQEDQTIAEQTATDTIPAPEAEPAQPETPDPPGDVVVYFDYNSTSIINEEILRSYIPGGEAYLEAVPDACVQVTGHTCDIGSGSYNVELGSQRAATVKDFLEHYGLENECLEAGSKGETDPAVPNTSEVNRKKNRRVVVHME